MPLFPERFCGADEGSYKGTGTRSFKGCFSEVSVSVEMLISICSSFDVEEEEEEEEAGRDLLEDRSSLD